MRIGETVINAKNPKDNGKKLTFHGHGGTNSTVVLVDGRPMFFGPPSPGRWSPMKEDYGRWGGKKSVWKYDDGITVTQYVELYPGEPVEVDGHFKRQLDTVRVRYVIENHDKQPHQVGIRVLIDTLIGKDISNDGVPFTVPGLKKLVKDFYDVESPQPIPDFVQVLENPDLKNPGIVGYINLKLGGKVEPPSRLSLTRWQQARLQDWEIPIVPIQDPKGGADSSVVIYWKAKELRPGGEREVGYSYGLGDVSSKSGMLAITVGGVKTPGQELTVTALVQSPKAGEKLTLKLPDGMRFKEGVSAEQVVPPEQGGQAPVTWHIEATRQGNFDLEVTSTSGVKQKKRVVIKESSIF